MNRRIKKKLQKRFWYKRYSEFRIMRFFELVSDRPKDSLLYIVTGKKSKNNKAIHSVSLLTNIKPIPSLPIMNDTENKTFTLEFSANPCLNDEKFSLSMNKVVNRVKLETTSLNLSSLESATNEIQKCMREKIEDNVLELLSKPPGYIPFPSDYGPTVKEYLNAWISGIKGGDD